MANHSAWESNTPLVIAHRGASAYAPENTASAFHEAIRMKADAAELDAKLLKDGNIIVLHDTTLDRTTNGQGSVYQYTYDEIRGFDAGSHFSPRFSQENIPTLETILAQYGADLPFNIELTNYAHPLDDLPRAVITLVKKYQLEKRVLFSSFNPWSLFVSKRIEPSIPIALLLQPKSRKIYRRLMQMILNPLAIHPHYSDVLKDMVTDAKKHMRKINVWTINDKQIMMEKIQLGVNGLITNFPDIAKDVVKEFQNHQRTN